MIGRQMRFFTQHHYYGLGICRPKFSNLHRCMPVAGPDTAHVLSRGAIQPVDFCAGFPGSFEKFAKGPPIVTPVAFKANTVAQFIGIDVAVLPLIEDMLVTRNDGLDSQYDLPSRTYQ